ncbi:hypothetical protein EXT85_27980, partial [Klebsiella quasipneumoniae subsp. similipneumoniae]
GSCAAPSAKGDDKFITTDYLQQCPFNDLQTVTLFLPIYQVNLNKLILTDMNVCGCCCSSIHIFLYRDNSVTQG